MHAQEFCSDVTFHILLHILWLYIELSSKNGKFILQYIHIISLQNDWFFFFSFNVGLHITKIHHGKTYNTATGRKYILYIYLISAKRCKVGCDILESYKKNTSHLVMLLYLAVIYLAGWWNILRNFSNRGAFKSELRRKKKTTKYYVLLIA